MVLLVKREQRGNAFITWKVKELLVLAVFHFFLRLNDKLKFVKAKVLGDSLYFFTH